MALQGKDGLTFALDDLGDVDVIVAANLDSEIVSDLPHSMDSNVTGLGHTTVKLHPGTDSVVGTQRPWRGLVLIYTSPYIVFGKAATFRASVSTSTPLSANEDAKEYRSKDRSRASASD